MTEKRYKRKPILAFSEGDEFEAQEQRKQQGFHKKGGFKSIIEGEIQEKASLNTFVSLSLSFFNYVHVEYVLWFVLLIVGWLAKLV